MKALVEFLMSSVGRKLVMGLSGLFLCSFLVVHLTINLFLFASDEGATFESYSTFLATYPLIRPVEWLLFAGFIVHMILGVVLWFANRSARPDRYTINRAAEVSTLSSRVMFWTGLFVLVFLAIHINTFFVQSRFIDHTVPMFDRVANAFKNPWYDAFYIVALGFLAYHLRHGFQSAFQTFGLRGSKYEKLIDAVAVIFWLFVPIAFAAIPVYFLWIH